MEGILEGDILKWAVMILVGALSGSLAARIIKGDSFGFAINAILGIAGAIVGGFIFDLLNFDSPGAGIVKVVDDQFGVTLPQNIVGMIISATVGSIIILFLSNVLGLGKRRRS
jgi:uncharacterized membrane protein YeaQ/YmgE (transglycosylase-associated protein family)